MNLFDESWMDSIINSTTIDPAHPVSNDDNVSLRQQSIFKSALDLFARIIESDYNQFIPNRLTHYSTLYKNNATIIYSEMTDTDKQLVSAAFRLYSKLLIKTNINLIYDAADLEDEADHVIGISTETNN
jgi:hypothetical protein